LRFSQYLEKEREGEREGERERRREGEEGERGGGGERKRREREGGGEREKKRHTWVREEENTELKRQRENERERTENSPVGEVQRKVIHPPLPIPRTPPNRLTTHSVKSSLPPGLSFAAAAFSIASSHANFSLSLPADM